MIQITDGFREAALRRGIIMRAHKASRTPRAITLAATVEFANLGFVANPDELSMLSVKALVETLANARKVIGADRDMVPVYPGFPKQVAELDTLTLIVEQLLHYWTGGQFLPDHPTEARSGLPIADMLRGARALRVLPVDEAVEELTRELVTNPIALSQDDKHLLVEAAKSVTPSLTQFRDLLRGSSNAENAQSLLRAVLESSDSVDRKSFTLAAIEESRTSDAVLRHVLTSYGAPAAEKWKDNFDLAVNTLADKNARAVRMRSIPRPVRRALVEKLSGLNDGFRADALVAREGLWRTVLRGAHAFEFAQDERSKRALDIVHGNVEHRTFASQIEEGLAEKDAERVIDLLRENKRGGELIRRAVALLRLVKDDAEAEKLSEAIRELAGNSKLTTLISAHNGIRSANDENARVTRVAGRNNTMMSRATVEKVQESHLALTLAGLEDAIRSNLKKKSAPVSAVPVLSDQAVSLVRRDASTSDRALARGEELDLVGSGDTLRIFGHWNNNMSQSGYMDIGVVVLDENFQQIATSTWNTWVHEREWSTYSGDKLVAPGASAPEFIDVDVDKLLKKYPGAKWATMTVQSWSGFPMDDVDFIAGAMLRSSANDGEVFDARTVSTAFHPTTKALQAVPFAVNLESNKLVWIDSSNGSMQSGVSSSYDETIGSIVYDEIARPRITYGELAELWADAHGAKTLAEPVEKSVIEALLD